MKLNNFLLYIFSFFLVLSACNKKTDEKSDMDKLKHSNKKSYPTVKMDSAQAINSITKQKIQELYDLSTLYAAGNKDTDIDSLIYSQMQSYFIEPDTAKIYPIIKELDSFKVRNVKVNSLEVKKEIKGKDTVDIASFRVEYFGNNQKSLGVFDKNAKYVLKKSPVKFVKEFKFYFIDFDKVVKSKKESEVTK